MGRWSIVGLIVGVAACGGGATPPPTTVPTTTASVATTTEAATTTTTLLDVVGWRADLEAFVAGLERLHPDPYWRVGEATFAAEVAALEDRLATLNEDEATLEFVRLAALIDGHTSVFVGFLGWELSRIQLYAFEDGIGVVGTDDPTLLGGRLLAIGDTPAEEAFTRASVLASFDNPMTKSFTTPFFLAVPRLLAGLGITDDSATTTYTIETVDGTVREVTPETGNFGDYRDWFGDPVIGLPASERVPYLARRTNPIWWESLGDGTIYVQYNQVTAGGTDPATGDLVVLGDVVTEVRAALDAAPDSRLVLDVRHNGGGDNHTYGRLLTLLEDQFSDACGLFVITGRATFSAAVNFTTEVDQQTQAIFVGEPTGGSPNLYADIAVVNLPTSGLQFRVSRIYWEFGGPDDDRIWIEPDVAAPPLLSDWVAGRDAALEAALAAPLCGF